jgi:hypothetical protein
VEGGAAGAASAFASAGATSSWALIRIVTQDNRTTTESRAVSLCMAAGQVLVRLTLLVRVVLSFDL